MAFLKIRHGLGTARVVPLSRGRTVIGRHPRCQIVLDHPAISRQHAEIFVSGEHFFLEDLDSNNGTYVNGLRLDGRTQLHDSDEIRLCEVTLSFHRHVDGESEPSSDDRHETSEPRSVGAENAMEAFPPAQAAGEVRAATPGGGGDVEDTQVSFKVEPGGRVVAALGAGSDSITLRLGLNADAKLRSVVKIANGLCRALDLDVLLPKVLEGLFDIFPEADTAAILQYRAETGQCDVRATRTSAGATDSNVAVSRTVAAHAVRRNEAVLVADVPRDRRFRSSDSLAQGKIRSMMCAPVSGPTGECWGVIQIGMRKGRRSFSAEDLDVLVSVAAQAGLAIENARLHQELLEYEKHQEERIAALHDELLHAARLGALGEMAVGVAHELRQPLTSIVNYAGGAERRLKAAEIDTPGLIELLSTIKSQAMHGSQALRSILNFARRGESERRPVDLREPMHDAVTLAAPVIQKHGAEIVLEPENELPPADADPVQVVHVILNLLVNAVEAAGEAGEPLVNIRTARHSAGYLEVAVSDNGPGIAEEIRERVFDQFFTSKPYGLGVGLGISRSIVESHGGRIWLESGSGSGGSTFRFTLPISHRPHPDSEARGGDDLPGSVR